MRIGSLVELVNDDWDELTRLWHESKGGIYPVKKKIYTIREFYYLNGTAITLEEIINPKIWSDIDGFGEICFSINRFRELMPPTAISIDEIISETHNCH